MASEDIWAPRLLLGEGKEERVFFTSLLQAIGVPGIQVMSYDGKAKLRDSLNAVKVVSGFANLEVLAVTRDADADADAAFESVKSALVNAGLPCPSSPGGFSFGHPRVGVLILPPGESHGMLEDLCLASVASDAAMPCVDEFMKCVQERASRTSGNPAKARIHAWLASLETPDRRLGEAAQAGCWPWDSPAFAPLRAFIQQVAAVPSKEHD